MIKYYSINHLFLILIFFILLSSIALSGSLYSSTNSYYITPDYGLQCSPISITRTIQAGQSNSTNITVWEANQSYDQTYYANFSSSSGAPGNWTNFTNDSILVPNYPITNYITVNISVPSGTTTGIYNGTIFVNSSDPSRGNCTIALNVTVCVENWSCTDWSACVGSVQTRTCTDLNECGTEVNKPSESQSCAVTPPGGGPVGGWITPICGNDVCEWGESSENCPEDCPPSISPEAPIVLDIDIGIESGSEQVLAGQRVYATINLQKAGGPTGPTDVNLTYLIRDPEGRTIDYKKTTIAVETIRRDIYFLSVTPGSSLGVYNFEASVAYNDIIDTSSATFQVVAEIPKALIVIKSIDVPLMFEGDRNSIIIVLENQIENSLNVNVSIFFPEKFEPKEVNKSAVIGALSEEVFIFIATPMVSGSFNGFILIKYDGRGLTRDFPINVYPSIVKWGWIVIIVLLIIILIVVYRRKRIKHYHELTLRRLRVLRRRRRR